jgi:hypothetical protein
VREFRDVKVRSMKKFLGSLLIIAAGLGGFLWWKRNQVIEANEVAADPWPVAVVSPDVTQAQAPTDPGVPEVEPGVKKAVAKKAPVKKSAAKKATSKPLKP